MRRWIHRVRERLAQNGRGPEHALQEPSNPRSSSASPLTLSDWKSQDPGLAQWSTRHLSETAKKWLAGAETDVDLVRELAPNLFELSGFFDPDWTRRLSEELSRVQNWTSTEDVRYSPPNSMHYAGFEVAPIGWGDLMNQLSEELITQLAHRLYPDREWPVLSDGHGFVAQYGEAADRSLGLHVDDSDVTMTLCLGSDFEGSEIVFEGIRCPLHQQTHNTEAERVIVAPVPGNALIHLGAHRHRVSSLLSGHRQSLILWARGASTRDERLGISLSECPDWCDF